MKNKLLKNPLVWIVVVLLVGGAGYGAQKYGLVDLSRFSLSGSAPSSQEFIARVNGENLKAKLVDLRFAQIKNSYEAQGKTLAEKEQQIIRQQILNDMIDGVLLAQYGKEQGFTPPNEMVDSEYQLLLTQFPSEEEFQKTLTDQEATVEDVRQTITQDLIIQQIITQQTLENEIIVTEEEIQQAYDEAVAQGTEVPPFEEAKTSIEEFLRQQKIGQLVNELIGQLREKATIEILG